jgi:hypothetical protein
MQYNCASRKFKILPSLPPISFPLFLLHIHFGDHEEGIISVQSILRSSQIRNVEFEAVFLLCIQMIPCSILDPRQAVLTGVFDGFFQSFLT